MHPLALLTFILHNKEINREWNEKSGIILFVLVFFIVIRYDYCKVGS